MPELPEVEVVKRSLNNKIQNLIIKEIKINDGSLRYPIVKNELRKVVGLKLKKITRRSKYLLFFFNKDFLMLIHLGMTGKLFFVNKKSKKFKTSFYYNINNEKDQKHDRVIFYLSKNQKLIYNDVRKFGFIKFYNLKDLNDIQHLKNLGPEPLEHDFNYTYFKKYIIGRKRVIKEILMSQNFVSGIGNIYANEILFLCKVKPTRNVNKLKNFEIRKIIKLTKNVLNSSIKLGGSTIKNFSSSNGKKGSFQQHFNVYGKKNEVCSNRNCVSKVVRSIVSKRSTFHCPKCQK